jgi:hypothetical protein
MARKVGEIDRKVKERFFQLLGNKGTAKILTNATEKK